MKKIFMLSALIALAALATFCSDESSINQTNDSHTSAKKGPTAIILTFSNNSEFVSGLSSAVKNLAIEDSTYLKSDKSVTNIVNNLKIIGGKVYLSEKHYVNTTTKQIVRSLILDTSTMTYSETNEFVVYEGTPVAPAILGSCPGGSTEMGTCMGSADEISACVGAYAVQFQHLSLSAGDFCGSIMQNNGLFSTAVCITGCS